MYGKSGAEREVHSKQPDPKEKEKSQISNLILHLKELEKTLSPKLVEGRK